jgi:hypothetical protein
MRNITYSLLLCVTSSSAWSQTIPLKQTDPNVLEFYSQMSTVKDFSSPLSISLDDRQISNIQDIITYALANTTNNDQHGAATSEADGDLSGEQQEQLNVLLGKPNFTGFCSMVCATAPSRTSGSCGTPGVPDNTHICKAIVPGNLVEQLIGNQHDRGTSPFVDDGSLPDGKIPAGYTFLGQFIDHDLTKTMLDLRRVEKFLLATYDDLNYRSSNHEYVPIDMTAFVQIAKNISPGGVSGSTSKLDLDAMYGVKSYDEIKIKSAKFPNLYEDSSGIPTGVFNVVHMQAVEQNGKTIDGFDYKRDNLPQSKIVADPRNNENRVIGQIQLILISLHNTCMKESEIAGRGSAKDRFNLCQKLVRWTYQTIVATDFLPRILDDNVLKAITNSKVRAASENPDGTQSTTSSQLPTVGDVKHPAYACTSSRIGIPHEFATAAFRLGHSLLRNDYELRAGQPRAIFVRNDVHGTPLPDVPEKGLEADRALPPDDIINWTYFFDAGGKAVQHGRPLDTLISERLFSLPTSTIPPGNGPGGKDTPEERNLPRRNILRASQNSASLKGAVTLATGEETWDYLKGRIPDLVNNKARVIQTLKDRIGGEGYPRESFDSTIPLWLWILAEAEGTENSTRLGEVGSHLVGEFIFGSLACDSDSIIAHRGDADLAWWRPTKEVASTGRYSMPQLIGYLEESSKRLGSPLRLSGN